MGFNIANMSLSSVNIGYINLIKLDGIPIKSDAFKDFSGNYDEVLDMNNVYIEHLTSTQNMFYNSKNFNKDISFWDVSNVIDMTNMFYKASDFNQDISGWNVSNVENMNGFFNLRILLINH